VNPKAAADGKAAKLIILHALECLQRKRLEKVRIALRRHAISSIATGVCYWLLEYDRGLLETATR
jgi:hypothetical protein